MVNGKNIFILAGEDESSATIIAGTRSNEVRVTCDNIEVSSPTSGQWREYLAGRSSWTVSTGFLVGDASRIKDLLKVRKHYYLAFASKDGDGETTIELKGVAILTECQTTATIGNLVQGSFRFVGTGPVVDPNDTSSPDLPNIPSAPILPPSSGGDSGSCEVVEEAPENDVNFYDYDGFRVASFSIEEAKALTQEQYDAILPPAHEGLTFQEWNWTLEDIQTYDRQLADIGANYTPNDNKCHIKANIPVDLFTFYLYLRNVRTSPVLIDWGDGNIETVSTDKNTHQYQQAGKYHIKISLETEAETTTVGIDYTESYSETMSSVACIKELNLSGWLKYFVINRITSLISMPAAPIEVSGCTGVLCKEFTIPRLLLGSIANVNITAFLGHFCFPKYMQNLILANVINGIAIRRLVIPEHESTGTSLKFFQNSPVIEEISLPSRVYFYGTTFMSSFTNLKKIDIPAGFIPPTNMLTALSTKFIREDIVDFLNKLGTTTNVITLTFGATNLNKLTEEEKAIATNKGYTLA